MQFALVRSSRIINAFVLKTCKISFFIILCMDTELRLFNLVVQDWGLSVCPTYGEEISPNYWMKW